MNDAGLSAALAPPPASGRPGRWARLARPAATPGGLTLRILLLALLYALGGWCGQELSQAPSYATPIWPPSGIGLALLLLWGLRLWPGVWLGAFAINLTLSWDAAAPALALLIAAALSSGSTLATVVGARLLRPAAGQRLTLERGRQILRFFLVGGMLGPAIAASASTVALGALGALAEPEAAFHWVTWWIGDAMGVFLVAPMLLIAAQGPGPGGLGRLRVLGIAVSLSLLVGSVVVQQAQRAEARRIGADFEQRAQSIQRALAEALSGASAAVHTTADHFRASSHVDADEFAIIAGGQLPRAPGLELLGWAPQVAAADRAGFEAQAAAEGLAGYRVRGRTALAGAAHYPLRYVWPMTVQGDALGLDLLAQPEVAAALEAAQAAAAPRLSTRFSLPADHGPGVLLLAPVQAAQGGVVAGIIVLERLMATVLAPHRGEALQVTLTDPTTAQPLWGERPASAWPLLWTAELAAGGRSWTLAVSAGNDYIAAHRSLQAWLTGVGVLCLSALVGGFMLALTGKSARVERLVAERTAELEDRNQALSAEVAERKRNEARLRLSSEVFQQISEAVMITDSDNRIVAVNRAFSQITGYDEAEIHGLDARQLAPPQISAESYADMGQRLAEQGVWRGELIGRRRSGELFPQWFSVATVRDAAGRIAHYVSVFSDISERKAAEERILFLAQVDPLTDLPNRNLLSERLTALVDDSRRDNRRFAVMLIDIDRFKNINDSLGHSVGDALLRETALRLRAAVRNGDMVARHGGDEFVLLMPTAGDEEEASAAAQRLLTLLAQPVVAQGHPLATTASIGVALFPVDGGDAGTLMKHADAAMYAAKNAGRNTARRFTRDMNARVEASLRIENELRRALAAGELRVHYQPQFDAGSGELVGAEALVRWAHPERGLILPGAFIGVAEESGLIEAIGSFVLDEACRQNRAWQDAGLPPIPISVNLSAAELHREDMAARVERVLAASGLEARYLELEVTESMLMRDIERVGQVLQQLRAMGVRVALDDFGTGYSSLAYLRQLPLSALKVDRSFVRDLQTDSNDAAICRAVIALGRSLNLRVVAEGVENAEQLAFLRANRCDAVQGALFSWGVPADDLARMLAVGSMPDPLAAA